MKNESIAEAIFCAPKCIKCDIDMYPFVEKVFLPPEYVEKNYYRNRWFCGYCVFEAKGDMQS
jgi:hypothetical protein